MELTVNSNIKS